MGSQGHKELAALTVGDETVLRRLQEGSASNFRPASSRLFAPLEDEELFDLSSSGFIDLATPALVTQ